MNRKLKEKIRESLTAVVPVTVIVLLLGVTVTPMTLDYLMLFLVGAALLIVGMGFFTMGADMAMMPIGEHVGIQLTKGRKLGLILGLCFVIGVLITVAEPDLQVLAEQTPGVPNMTLIFTVAVGVGIMLTIAFLRVAFHLELSWMLLIAYGLIFGLAVFSSQGFLAVAFDSGGVTTGPITVPFIMALGLGLNSMRGDKAGEDASFGMVALCSVGPVLAVMILGMIFRASEGSYTPFEIPDIVSTQDLWFTFGKAFPKYVKEVLTALVPILGFFFVFQAVFIKLRRKAFIKILVGMLYTFIGLTLFLTGVNVGFMPVGNYIGIQIASLPYNWILIPLGMVIGFFIVKAEPAVLVLNKQVEEVTGGAVSQKTMMTGLSIGMAVSLGLAMIRVMTGVSILWILVPGYAIALTLSFVVPKIFTGIAFDSGGVASGPMTATFLLPFAMGACEAVGGNVLTDAFGVVAMVAMTPLITIQLLGVVYRLKTAKAAVKLVDSELEEEIIDYTKEDVQL